MKPHWTLPLLLLLLAPAATAAPSGVEVDKEQDTLTQAIDGIHVQERSEFHLVTSTGDRTWSFLVYYAAQGLKVAAETNGEAQTVNATQINRSNQGSGIAFWDTVTVNVTALFPNAQGSDKLALILEYDVAAPYDHQLTSSPATLVVFAEPKDGFQAVASNLPAFMSTGTRSHAAMSNPPAGFRFTVDFEPASSSGTQGAARDLTHYLWAAAGLVVGFVLAMLLARRGAFNAASKKFVKGGDMESGAMLEARRRTLMASLKELELGHEAKEIPDSAYAPLKEEYKAQTVKVMRSLDDKKETPKS